MKNDIDFPEIKNVAVAIVEELKDENKIFNVYLINMSADKLENVLVSSTGYGTNVTTNEKVSTSVLRHFLDNVEAESYKKIEPIMTDLFGLNNQYWVSFKIGNEVFDKKYIFLAETVLEKNYVDIPLINKKGIIIQ
jgi:hypothetical protein